VKAAIIIGRRAEYRLYAPVIEAAFARGWQVECWHDFSQARTGPKGYQFPALDAVPAFRNGTPAVRPFSGLAEIGGWLAAGRVDVVLAASLSLLPRPLPSPRPFLVCLQSLIDSLAWDGPDVLLEWDLLALHSRWWLRWAAEYFAIEGLLAGDNADGFTRRAEARARYVGLPELDESRLIDPEEVRHRWGIPPRQPVVVLLPFPQGVGRQTFWPKYICAEPSRLRQVARIIAHRRPRYLSHVWHGWNDPNVVKALRRFCDRNGAYLLVKSRLKTPIPRYTERLADLCVYDERFYPATVLEALSIASLSVSYYSNSVFESVGVGVPHLCVTFTAEDYNGGDSTYFSRFYTPQEGSAFQFRGVSTAWSIPETLARLPARTLADFAMDPTARIRYIDKFLTHDAGDGGVRTIEAIERAFRSAGREAAAPA
jgi:hypothetical protein